MLSGGAGQLLKTYIAATKMTRRAPRRKIVAYASTGSHCGPWVSLRDDIPGLHGRMAVFETYRQALTDAGSRLDVHRVTLLIETEPASP